MRRTVPIAFAFLFLATTWGGTAGAGPVLQWPGRFRLLLNRLQSKDPRVLIPAIAELSSYPLSRIEAPMLKLLDDDNKLRRMLAAKTLVEKGSHKVLPHLMAWLASPESDVRQAALVLMQNIGGEAALAEAVKALRDMDPNVRKVAVETVGALGAQKAIRGLLSALSDDAWEVRAAAAKALGRVTDPRAVIGLIGVLGDERPDVRKAAVEALGRIGDPRAAQAVLRALSDSDKKVRKAAIHALGNLRAPQVVQVLLDRGLRSREYGEREAIADALGRLRSAPAASALVTLLSLFKGNLRRFVATRLAQMGTVAVGVIVKRLSAPDVTPAEVRIFVQTLGRIQDPAASAALVRELRRGRVPATLVLGALVGSADWRAVPFLVDRALRPDADEEVVSLVVAALDRAADARSRVQVTRLFRACRLCREDDKFRLVTILGRIQAIQALGDVLKMARSGPLRLRRAALEALGWFGDRRASGVILDILQAGPRKLRFAAADAGVHCLGPKGLSSLLGIVQNPGLGLETRAVALRSAGILIRRLKVQAGGSLELFGNLALRGDGLMALAAAEALGATRKAKAADLLLRVAFDQGSPKAVRCRAVEMLGAFRRDSLVDKLATLIRSHGDCASDAAWVIGKVGRGASARKIIRDILVGSPVLDAATRRNLVASLARLATPADRAQLLGLLRDRDQVVRVNALAGLAHLGRRAAQISKAEVSGLVEGIQGLGGLESTLAVSARALGFRDAASRLSAGKSGTSLRRHADWIVVQVLGEDGRPRVGTEYFLGTPHGLIRSGRLGPDGVVHEERIAPGTCQLVVRQ